ncbi:similar to Saccharomyces cerevisiae YEL029C BUD16 Putative pyridoxal kinase, a key enzyme involved in pyridoxal 5'-phosphate synthesis, the active form of vitamin B6 [Maudiozyma saulgeensis]|uniref:pyridoxal kinase n=1 Tax=Maudiozyma saulgeensis TaxID=1789683 RepID=A0A1X7QXM4_9SACH|nr:similar to Saccharomyces cerevisiae YEL029C BUD16 Putative pyridoxal kinase, a key enzyme involved in pyridoxal 5'-phosphate synthesis, the active form of vitamin B6 [Kazachstania saulgeensis]
MPRLLATQSHVVHGYVGNKAATFPLQCLGWDVDCCNSVQFSNHTGYGMDRVFGNITNQNDLEALLGGVFANFATDYDAILSGYLPNKESVNCMGQHYSKFKAENKKLLWLMDPVMGDEGQLYVNEDVIPEYQKLTFSPDSLVDIITPNQYELEILYGKKISSREELKQSLQELHKTVPVIVVTSCSSELFDDKGYIYCVASIKGENPVVYRIPFIDTYFTGVGDLFSALLLDRITKLYQDETSTLKFADQIDDIINVLQRVLKMTKYHSKENIKSKMGSVKGMKDMELRIVESRDLYHTIPIVNNDLPIDFSNKKYLYEEL